ncbi:MAG: transposase [Bacteroidetes bacterium]|nr:transposase [Bacteroidota bacterium]MCL5027346.1 transposase [Chloroflexota bacterium]
MFDPNKLHRQTIRLQGYDYSQAGAYFVTICIQNRASLLFGDIVDGSGVLPSQAGAMVAQAWSDLPLRFPWIRLDAFVVMPNHIHGVIFIERQDRARAIGKGERDLHSSSAYASGPSDGKHRSNQAGDCTAWPRGTSEGSLGRIIQAFKSLTTREYIIGVRDRRWPPFLGKLWQRNYYEHIVRGEDELDRIRHYIDDNPLKWQIDQDNPATQGQSLVTAMPGT